jgi:hypothetical protein
MPTRESGRQDHSARDDRIAGDDAALSGKQAREAAVTGDRCRRDAHSPGSPDNPSLRPDCQNKSNATLLGAFA